MVGLGDLLGWGLVAFILLIYSLAVAIGLAVVIRLFRRRS
jgi:NADH:ubiquinone oxidoreductase subunit K